VNAKHGVEFAGGEEQYLYSDYRNLFNLEAHRANKTKDEMFSLR
jgi:hypothetical protein